jgi:two-component system CheB/CheR fusion protein
VGIRVEPALELAPGYALVIFEVSDLEPSEAKELPAPRDPEPALRHLERELESMRNRLRETVEQYEANTEELKASNEELKASNEELQAMNEELRSASEELETSREELQSSNEELTTVNQELKGKVDELALSNSDLHNLMASTAIATIFLDRELRIMRFTPPATGLFNLIPGDVGRPLSDLQHRLEYPQLAEDAQGVLDKLIPVERQVPTTDGRAFLARLLPYRTLEDRIAGVVLTCVDVTEQRRAEESLRIRNDELERFNRAAVGREIRMVELKRQINALSARLGEPPPYEIAGDEPAPAS